MKILFILILFLFMISSVNALIVNQTVIDDTYVNEFSPDGYHNESTTLNAGYYDGGWVERSFMKFDISDIVINSSNTAIIDNALVYIHIYKCLCHYDNQYPLNLTISHVKNNTWSENLVSYNNQPTNISGPVIFRYFNYIEQYTNDSYYSFDVKDLVQYESANGNKNVSIAIDQYNMCIDGFGYCEFHSKENTSYQPYIEVTYNTPLIPSQIDFSKFNYIRQYGKILSNHNKCIDNETLGHNITYEIRIDLNQSIINVWAYEPCEFGCDTTTNKCNDSSINQYLIIGLILLIIVVIIIIIIKVIT